MPIFPAMPHCFHFTRPCEAAREAASIEGATHAGCKTGAILPCAACADFDHRDDIHSDIRHNSYRSPDGHA